MKNMSDTELVLVAQQGNKDAISEIFERYQKSLYYVAYQITNNAEDAQDALQDTFLQVTKSIDQLKKPEFLKLWLNRIIVGKCKNIFRSNKTVGIDIDNPYFHRRYLEERREFLPEQQMRFTNDKDVVDYFILQLPRLQQEALIMMYAENMTLQQIAEQLHEPLGTVKSRVHLARKTLKKSITAYENREGVKLNFRSSAYAALLSGSLLFHHKGLFQKGFQPLLLYKAAAYIIIAAVSVTGIAVYQNHRHINEIETKDTLLFQNQKIRSDKYAYFILMNWAMNEKQLKLKTHDEIKLYQPLYEFLKTNNSSYYQGLQASGFDQVLEAYFK